jgi:hypothetical protein
MIRLLFVLAAMMALNASASYAQDEAMTVGDLQTICTSTDTESKSACRFYILGVTQGIDMGMSMADGKTQGGRPCVPPNASSFALEFAVKRTLGEDLMLFPNDRKLDASGFVGAAIIKTFPCRKPN